MGGFWLVQSILVFRVCLPIRREPVFILDSLLDPVPVVSLRGSRPESVLQYLGIFRFPGGRREVTAGGAVVARLQSQYQRRRGVEDRCRSDVQR